MFGARPKPERKRAQERVSGWLGNYDFVEATGGWLLKNIPEDRLDGCTFAVDFSDISKVGMDGAEHLWTLKRDERKAVVRVNRMDRDVFGDGLHIDASLRSAKFFDAMLHVHTGDRRVKIRCRPGVVQYCKDPKSKDAVTEDVRVLVVESRFDEKSIYLYVIRDKGDSRPTIASSEIE